jgi:AraC-like DNA-binding protein
MNHAIRNKGKVPAFFSKQVLEANRFYLDTHSRGRRPLAVVCGGCEHCEADYKISRDDFPFHSVEFVARGRGTLSLQGQTVSLLPGVVFSYGPRVPHTIASDADRPLVKYFVDFTGPQAGRILSEHGLAPGTVVQVASPDAILRIFDDLIANGTEGSRYSPSICATLVELLVLKIAEAKLVDQTCHTPAFATYQTCREFIRGNYLVLKTLEEIAEACHVDEAYLCRLFRRFDSQSPYQYLMRLKMSEAARRLQRQSKLTKEIAYDLGFDNSFHFSRVFKRVFGLSPKAFRQLR